MISSLDLMVIVGYLLLMLLIGYLSGRNNKDQDDYFLAGRTMPWLPVALSVAATMISANSFIGGPGWAYEAGMFPVMVNVAVPFAVFFALYVTTPVIYHLNITSVYQYMGLRFGKYARAITIFQFFINSLIQASSMVFVPVLIIQRITGWPLTVLVPAVVVISIAYTLMGGIKAVIWTDAIQMIVVIGAVILVIITSVSNTGMGVGDILRMAKESGKLDTLKFSLDVTDNNTFLVTLIGGAFMWIRYFCFDQAQVQRVLTSRSLEQAKKSFVFSAFMMNIVYYFMLFIGVLLFFFYKGRGFVSSNDVMITFILEEIPKGAVGLIVAGVFAAAMSSVDSLLNSMTAVFSKDIYEHYLNKEEASLKVNMLLTVLIGIIMIAVILIGFGSSVRSVLDLVGNYISYFSGPAAGAFLLGLFTCRANDRSVAAGMVSGFAGNMVISYLLHPAWLWNPVIGAVITMAVGYTVSFCVKTDRSITDIRSYTVAGLRKDSAIGRKLRPCYLGKYEKVVLCFFLLQYVVFYVIQY